MKDYKKIVKEALHEVIGVEMEENQYGLDLFESGLMDSLSMVNMVVLMEESLGKRIDSKYFTNDDFRSFSAIQSLIERV